MHGRSTQAEIPHRGDRETLNPCCGINLGSCYSVGDFFLCEPPDLLCVCVDCYTRVFFMLFYRFCKNPLRSSTAANANSLHKTIGPGWGASSHLTIQEISSQHVICVLCSSCRLFSGLARDADKSNNWRFYNSDPKSYTINTNFYIPEFDCESCGVFVEDKGASVSRMWSATVYF